MVKDFQRDVPPAADRWFELRFETAASEQMGGFRPGQVVFTDELSTPRIVRLFSMVLGYSRPIWARFVMHQGLATVVPYHVAALYPVPYRC